MNKFLYFCLLIALVLTGVWLWLKGNSQSAVNNKNIVSTPIYTDIDSIRLKAMLSNKDFYFINVHTPYQGEIEKTDAFIPYDQIDKNLNKLPKDKNAKIVLYCQSGRMSAIAERTMNRRAIEALRNGVPNGDAVRALGCDQPHVESRFRDQLEQMEASLEREEQVAGLLVAGGFGTGKSHVLEYLEHMALAENFVTSHIVISKETPLHDPSKVFRAAVESAQVPGRSGMAVHEIALRLRQDTPRYAALYLWANGETSGVSPIFPATLLLHERLSNDPELTEEVRNFWAGDNLPVRKVRDGLRQIGELAAFSIRAVKARDLALQRFSFVARLIRGAGYRGWVLLIDEVELVGRYSLLQRGRSYGELAHWMGRIEDLQHPGLTSVAAMTDDFDLAILQQKGDRDYVGARFRDRGTDEFMTLAARAEAAKAGSG